MRRFAFAALLACAALPVAMLAVGLLRPLPPVPLSGARILARDGSLLGLEPAPDGVWRLATTADRVSPLLIDMLIASEDHRFAQEPGVDGLAILRAAWQWARAGHVVSGASTLAMQVARLSDPRPRTLAAKALEASRALALSFTATREKILGRWLSLAPFGGNLVGVEAASRAWFGKPPGTLDAAEAALLVALPRRPEALRPDRHPEAARTVRDRVLRLAAAHGVIGADELTRGLAAPVPGRWPMPRPSPPQLFHPGEDVATTLDAGLQASLDRLAAATLTTLPPRVSLAVMVAALPERSLRAIHAGDWADAERQGAIDLTAAQRSPGSALKPFLYGLAFSDGLAGPHTWLADAPRRYGGYAPENISTRFDGRVTAAEALQRSLNLPAIDLLARYGPVRFTAALAGAGAPLALPPRADPGLPVALGGGGETLRQLMALYAGLATDGQVRALPWRDGPPAPAHRLLTPEAATTIAAILTRPIPGSPRAGIAWKTGTSAGDRDAWAFGFDRAHLVGVWIGRPDGGTMAGSAAADIALPVLSRVFGLLPEAPRPVPRIDGAVSLAAAPAADPLRLLFPPADSVVTGLAPLDLSASGGTRPLRFLIDGAPIDSLPALRQTRWLPAGPGFYRITVVDAAGGAAHATIRVKERADP